MKKVSSVSDTHTHMFTFNRFQFVNYYVYMLLMYLMSVFVSVLDSYNLVVIFYSCTFNLDEFFENQHIVSNFNYSLLTN
jgi:hypothetical protein